ncbi:MogA/MoaB family molybdenum cofactor biosynthesis protein [Halorubrum laminariae]|uniref:Molybdenum cofactor biosynthesis protein B n=1 Tax=Halorubrum laminariae TaxID=1433523 RepID=A0ABD6C113_9EURY|nr:molybdenum cofactor synthesis domain-containing protein [Halorubrum laminariae]
MSDGDSPDRDEQNHHTGHDSHRDHHDDQDHHTGHDDHDHHNHDAETVSVAVVTVSSSRSLDSGDTSGEYIAGVFEEAGHEVAVRELVPDEYDSVQGTVDRVARRKDTDVVVTTGGTGVTPDDVTPEAVRPLFAKTLSGFGELFRRLSYEEVGTRTIGSRATAGITAGTPVFCLPGSENAVRLGVDEILLPEVGHLVGLAGRGREDDSGDADEAKEAEGTENSETRTDSETR